MENRRSEQHNIDIYDKRTSTTKKRKRPQGARYVVKIYITFILFLVSLFLTLIFIKLTFSIINAKTINYQENSKIDYVVNLKDNDFYDEPYLGKDKVYIASLIKNIAANFDYNFSIDTVTDVNFKYNIKADLIIADRNGDKNFYEKEYTLLEDQTFTKEGIKNYNINEDITIDYNYYNNLANKFRTNYGVDSISKLIVKLNIIESNNDIALNNSSVMTLTIPLSERAININLNYKEVNKNSKLLSDKSVVINNYTYIIPIIVFYIVTLYLLIVFAKQLLSLRRRKSRYDREIDKILKEYDRLIVNTETAPYTRNKNIITVGTFDELLDVRDNLKLPIKYYIIEEHHESNFYIDHEDELYLLEIKSINLKTDK